MSVTDMLAFFKGSVTIEAEGLFLERFLNICMRRNIFLSDIKRKTPEKITARISIGGFRTIRPIAKKTKTRVKIVSREGIPFLINRYKKRRIAIAGLVLFLGILWYLSSHIMGIDIVGCNRLSASEIKNELKGFGLMLGTPTSKIDRRLLQNQMMTKVDELAWIGINIKGSRAYIEVRERLDTKRNLDKDIPCNIVASQSGRILGLEVRSGQTMVKINDMVEKGDLLVSGAVDSKVVGIRFEHSSAAVFAETTYTKSRVYPLKFQEKQYTGNKKIRYSIGGFGLYLKKGIPFEYCEKTENTNRHHLLGFDKIYIDIKSDTYKEYIPTDKTRTLDEAVALGQRELTEEMEKEVGGRADILNKTVTFKQIDENSVEVCAQILCREDIAQQSEIDKIENIE